MFNNIFQIVKKNYLLILLLGLFWLSINTGSKYLYINQFENLNFSYYQIYKIIILILFFLINYNDIQGGLKINNDLNFIIIPVWNISNYRIILF